jgi:hypothetical protein
MLVAILHCMKWQTPCEHMDFWQTEENCMTGIERAWKGDEG